MTSCIRHNIFQKLAVAEHVKFLKLMLKNLPSAIEVSKKSKKAKKPVERNQLNESWNAVFYDVIFKVLELYRSKPMDRPLIEITSKIVGKIFLLSKKILLCRGILKE